MIPRYWTCTKFADIIRGTKKISAGSAVQWDNWKAYAKSAHPVRFWLAETGIRTLENTVFFIPKIVSEIKYYIRNRYITKTHTLTSNLKKGSWYEFDTRVLHCLFDEFVNYIEVECARSYISFDEDKIKKYNISPLSYKFRSAEAGIDYLERDSRVIYNEELGVYPNNALYGKPTKQAEAAAEILALYKWWTIGRPARITPDIMSGWEEICRNDLPTLRHGMSQIHDDIITTTLGRMSGIEEAYRVEDTQMLIKLIELRANLWT